MFTQCFKCQLCSQAPQPQLKFLSVMKRDAPILLILDQPRHGIQLSEPQTEMVSMEFDEEYVNERTIATIGGILFTESEDSKNLDRIFPTMKNLEITYAVRCMTPNVPEPQMSLFCGIYTKSLLMGRHIIVTGKLGYGQLAEYLSFTPALPEFAPGKLFRSQYGAILTIDDHRNWSESDIRRYATLVAKAKKETGLAST